MDSQNRRLVNPQGGLAAQNGARSARRAGGAHRIVIGLIDNSKPNVAYFLDAVEEGIRGRGIEGETLRVTKPRAAGPLPDLTQLAARCDYVINAVAD